MNVYVLTEPDLDRLGDLNETAAFFTAAATFFGGLWIDLYKDFRLAAQIPEATKEALGYVQPLLAILALGFALAALVFWVKRGRHSKRIKRASRTKGRVSGEIRPAPSGDGLREAP